MGEKNMRIKHFRTLAYFIFMLGLQVMIQSPAGATSLSELSSSLKPGEWGILQTSGFSNTLFENGCNGGSITGFADSATWDPIARRFHHVGSPHCGGVPGNHLKLIQLDDTSNTWTSCTGDVSTCPASYLGSTHTFDYSTIDPATQTWYRRSDAATSSGLVPFSRYNFATNGPWEDIAPLFINYGMFGGLAWFPELYGTGGLIYAQGGFGEVHAWNKGANKWTQLAFGIPLGTYQNFAEYNPVHKVVVFGGGNSHPEIPGGDKAVYKVDANGVITRLKNAPISLGVHYSVFTVDPVSGDFIVLAPGKRLLKFDVQSDTWSELPYATLMDPAQISDSVVTGIVATPVSNYGVIVFLKYSTDTSNVLVYRHAAGGGTPIPPMAIPLPAADPASDFQARCAAPGVIRCESLDELPPLLPTTSSIDPKPKGLLAGTSTTATIDSGVRASGGGSLKFTVPGNSGSNASGAAFFNFSDDFSLQIGGNEEFYVQWRQRFSAEFLAETMGGGGWKQLILGTGSQPGRTAYSCTSLEVVTVNGGYRGFAQMYNSCTGSASHGAYSGFEEPFQSVFNYYDFKLQNARPEPYCLYSGGQVSPRRYFPPGGNCFGYFPNEWMTFQFRIKTGPRIGNEFVGSYVELWIAREGQPSEQVINWGPYNLSAGDPASNERFGQLWLTPYDTGKSSTFFHPTAYTWYDELIISRNRIKDPGVTSPPPADDSTPPTVVIISPVNGVLINR
jgi:hypothetical protein